MNYRKGLAVVLAAFLTCGFGWFGGQTSKKAQSDKASSKNSIPRVAASESGKSGESRLAVQKTAEPAARKAAESTSGGGVDLATVSRVATGVNAVSQLSNLKVQSIPRPFPTPQDVPVDVSRITQVQQRIQEIMRANEKYKNLQQVQLNEVQRINEQTALHQRILQELIEEKDKKQPYRSTDIDKILIQEKMRIIQEQTDKNTEFLSGLAANRKQTAPDKI